MENFWTLPWRSIDGAYVRVEPFGLFRYPDEQASRDSSRPGKRDWYGLSFAESLIAGKRLTGKRLTGKDKSRRDRN